MAASRSHAQDNDVMISYSHEDRKLMQRIKGFLESRGIKVWMDDRLKTGDDFDETIARAIDESHVFLPIVSPTSIESKYCRWEVERAHEDEKTFFPVSRLTPDRIKELRKPKFAAMQRILPKIQWTVLDKDADFPEKMKGLYDGIKDEIQGKVQETTKTFTDQPQSDCKARRESERKPRVESKAGYNKTVENDDEDLDYNDELLHQEFENKTMKAFSILTFAKFAVSSHGLNLPRRKCEAISKNHRDDVEEQHMRMLQLWREINGKRATVEAIRAAVENYRKYI